MSSQQEPLRINGWQNGIADSPQAGLGLIRNADVESFPGAVRVAKQPVSYFPALNTVTFTVDIATNICTVGSTFEADSLGMSGAAVYLTSTGDLPVVDPVGLATGTVYYLIRVSATTFKFATSYKNAVGSAAGTAMDLTDPGTNVHTIHPIAVGTINWIIKDVRTGYYYMLDSNGRVWFVPTGSKAYLLHNSAIENVAGALTNASGNGLMINSFSSTTSTYLFTFRNAVVDVIDIFGTTAIEALAWSNAWQNLNTGAGVANSHHAVRGQDNIIYFCDGRYVGSIMEVAGQTFVPATGGTFTYNNQALDLPIYEIAQCLEELDTNLLVGGNIFNKIYPWDRISDSFSIPLIVPEKSIKRMKNIGSTVYILAGSSGNIYLTQGSYVKHFKKIPTNVINNAYTITATPITWGGIDVMNGKLLVGIGGTTSGSSGVYKIDENGVIIHDNTPVSGSTNVLSFLVEGDFYLMGYAGGADYFNTAQYASNFPTVIHSELFPIGDKIKKASYHTLEVQLARPMTSGSIRVGYRKNDNGSFTTLATFTSDATETSFKEDIGLTDVENIMVQTEMQGNGQLLEVILHP